MFTCNLQDSLECTKVRSPLIPVFIAIFVFIFLITFFAPIPSVVAFFLWTLGLTYGVVYVSYAYSPLCFPRIPVALGEGLYDVVTDIFPERLNFPLELKQSNACETFHIDSSTQFLIALETFYRGGTAYTSKAILELCNKRIELDLCRRSLQDVDIIAQNIKNPADRTASYYCAFFSLYRIIALTCAFIFFAPIVIYIAALVLPLFLNLCSLSISSVYFLIQVNADRSD